MKMLLLRLPHLPWQLTCVLFAVVATAQITPSNSSTTHPRFQGKIPLRHVERDSKQIAGLVPLTKAGAQQTIEGNLHNTNFSSVAKISDNEIAYISCEPSDYPGNVDAYRVLEDVYHNANLSGVILYSTESDYCAFNPKAGQDSMQNFPILSMTDRQESAKVLASIANPPLNMKYFVQVQNSRANTNGQEPRNPLGPTPSTAVAMIILYAITGCVTALFVVIIITGAIRAHRNPERYGPRNVVGRQRQSRARGLGRAILDTIPIVKFGEKEPTKPTDVELGPTVEARDTDARDTDAVVGATTVQETAETKTTKNISPVTPTVPETTQHTTPSVAVEHSSGIAPAETLAAATTTDTTTNDLGLGCSICTEDFEKGQDIRVLPCNHKFHPDCVDPWLLNVAGTCPLCRVDLNPVESRSSTDPNALAPPLNPEPESASSSHRRTAFRDILSLRYRPNASAEERISALRRLREQRDVDGANTRAEDVGRNRRSRRMSERLGDVFSGRTRRRSLSQQREGDDATVEGERRQ